MEKLLTLLSTFEPLSEPFTLALKERIIPTSPPKGHLLLEASKVSGTLYFLRKGFAVSYQHIKKKKHIEELFKEGTIIISPKSFLQGVPAQESIELLEGGDLFMISHESVMWLAQQFQEAKSLFLVPMIARIENDKERKHDLQLLDATQRYDKLKRNFPAVFRMIPLKQIATYLGMAAQTIGRVRRDDADYQPLRRKNRNK